MHETDKQWATSGHRFFPQVSALINEHKPKSILDYGCGKGVLGKQIKDQYPEIQVRLYDPGIKEYSKYRSPAQMIVCTDVLEHVEPEFIDNVLDRLLFMTRQLAFFVIHTADCGFRLPDGRPAHLIQKGQEWWEDKINDIASDMKQEFDIEYSDTGLPNRFQVTLTRSQ